MAMASSVFSATPTFQIRNKPLQVHTWPILCRNNMQLSPTFFTKLRNSRFGNRTKIKMQLSTGREWFWEAAPKPVKEFPWRKAWDALLNRSLIIGQSTFKWSLVTLFISTSISDVIFSIFTNRELLIPIGLLIGCLMTDFLNETLQETFSNSEHKGSDMPLVLIGCLFVVVKAVSTVFFAARTQVLLLHVANGGLLQVLWRWRNLLTENHELKKDHFFTGQDAPLSTSAKE